MQRVLVVDDDPEIAHFVAQGLTAAGFIVDQAATGREALALAMSGRHAAIVLDRMLPDLDGVAVLTALRAAQISRPVLFLSALGTTDERVAGLRAGADDYLAKPFSLEELVARIEALLRRPEQAEPSGSLSCGDLTLDVERFIARRGARLLDLKRREFQMLRFLLERQGKMVTRGMLLEGVWNYRSDHDSNVIEVHISRLRRKVDGDGETPLIHTVRGVGYVLSTEPRP